MLESATAGTALSADIDVDVEFLTLALQDDEWLEAELAAIVSEPSELPSPPRRTAGVDIDRSVPGDARPTVCRDARAGRPVPAGRWGGGGWRRTRSPPCRPGT